MNNLRLIFNPITGDLEYVTVSPTKQEVIGSILLNRDEVVSATYPHMSLLFDDNSILYSDDNFTNA
jgi:hypothetical protein